VARGESVVVPAGLTISAVLFAVLAASSWWTLHTHRESLRTGRERQVQMIGELLAESAGALLASNELSPLRSLVSAAALQNRLDVCRIVLADGSVLADREVSRITAPTRTAAQDRWPDFPGAQSAEPTTSMSPAGRLELTVPVTVLGRGSARLEIAGDVMFPLWADWSVQVGIAAIGAGGLVGLLLAYRALRSRLRGLGAIREALRCIEAGETSSHALVVTDYFGPEAKAWNRLLAERETLRNRVVLEGAAEKLLSRGGHEGELTAACDAMWTGFVILDAQATIRYANGAAAVLLKAKREQLVGAGLSVFVKEPAGVEALSGVASGKTRQRTSVEVESQGESGERTVLRLTARPMRREDSASAVMIVEDVTQQRVADESRNAFVAQVTHELRTPLTNIRLYVETLQDDQNDQAVRSKCINVISQEARRLERIVTDMLSVSEIEAGSLKLHTGDIRLDALFEEVEGDFRAQALDREIKLVFDLPPKWPVMQGDRDKILLAIHNLVGNALKYTPTGGAVTVKVQAEGGDGLRIEVTDNGIGISEDEQELIFDKFYRAKDRRIAGIPGSGIGLALARQVVRMHGGDITVKSHIDKGSTFTLVVPLGREDGPVAKAA